MVGLRTLGWRVHGVWTRVDGMIKITLPPLPEPDGWAGRDYYHRPATTLSDISKFKLEQARYTAEQMHEYAAAVSAAEIDKLRYERDLLRIVVEGTAAADELLETPEAIYRLARIAREALGETK